MTPPRYVVFSGSLGKGNAGDEELLAAFLRRHGRAYGGAAALVGGDRPRAAHPPPAVADWPLPLMAVGRRRWRGALARRRTRRELVRAAQGALLDYVLLGGLFGVEAHVRSRLREIEWAAGFAERVRFYFGDAYLDPAAGAPAPSLAAVARTLDRISAWIAVRSPAGAELLRSVGLRGPVHVGVDPVLHDRLRDGLPPRRPGSSFDLCVMNVCRNEADRWRPIWLGSAAAAARAGAAVRWVPTSVPNDASLSEDLMAALAREVPGARQELWTAADAAAGFADADAAVTTRLHGTIFSVTAGTPTLVCGYGAKLERLCDDLGLRDWLVTPAHRDRPDAVEAAVARFRRLREPGAWAWDADRLGARLAQHDAALAALDRELSDRS
ncbi:polysaccharide pyruvyl transferase family protein [Alienimonas sp. DA493]|uniref:polysaccharide pyruvyl transferase family protein n=1 Tax=Alienimonas sp. DA493 TaxID=3373605 RepID=UPI0037544B3D